MCLLTYTIAISWNAEVFYPVQPRSNARQIHQQSWENLNANKTWERSHKYFYWILVYVQERWGWREYDVSVCNVHSYHHEHEGDRHVDVGDGHHVLVSRDGHHHGRRCVCGHGDGEHEIKKCPSIPFEPWRLGQNNSQSWACCYSLIQLGGKMEQ